MPLVLDVLTRRMAPLVVFLGITGLLCATSARSEPGRGFNDSGQKLCYLLKTWTPDCRGSGQDAEFGRDVAHPRASNGKAGFYFRKICNSGQAAREGNCPAHPPLGEGPNEWGCTLDVVTGLMWELKTTDGGPRDKTRSYTRFGDRRAGEADLYIESVNSAKLCGHEDWRLPGLMELQNIADYGVAEEAWGAGGLAPMIEQNWFPNSSATGPFDDNRWWAAENVGDTYFTLDIRTGETDFEPRQYHYFVRAVRQDHTGTTSQARFVPDGEEVLDRLTGLIWRRCSEGQTWNGTTCVGDFLYFEWATALKHARAVGKHGTGWRMPNVKELASLAVIGKQSPAIDTDVFPNSWGGYYVSSTPVQFDIRWKWHVSFYRGTSGKSYKFISGALRLVREAP